ncbi:potassium channel family protein [Anaerobacillus isosaccharinicus]|uniref:Potassium channel family protein n=1 Tax=Anaerobacillus isosaccharinicus TaxID=1532552 RepID=A0AC62A490_9BACI|nr:ion channel [Anaerobacillus isosaccharinicus]
MHFFLKFSLTLIKMKNITLAIATISFILLCTFVMYFLEPDNFESLPNTLYFVMTTFSTVGYGDYSPVTMGGKNIFYLYVFNWDRFIRCCDW